jgi:beta-phosphoglucomutase
MLEAVIFDMDGVIIDSHPAHREAWRVFLTAIGRPISDAQLDFVLDGRKRSEILTHFLGELSEDEIREYGKLKDRFFREQLLRIRLIPGVVEMLNKLREAGIATAVATSASESRALHMFEQLQLRDSFDVVVTGNDVILGKPNPSIYALTCHRLKVAPGSSIAFEDAVSGVKAARAAGLSCVGIASHEKPDNLLAAGAVCVVDNFLSLSLRELERIIPVTIAGRR